LKSGKELYEMINSTISFFYTVISQLGYRHPLHPTQVHFPVGLIFGAFVLGVLGKVRRQPRFSRAAWYFLVIAMIWILPTVLTGFMDWRHFFAGAWLFPFAVKYMLASVLIILMAVAVFIGLRRGVESNGMVAVYALCLLTVAGLGFFGGELVYGGKAEPIAEKSQLEEFKIGREIYAANCGGCHADGGNVINPELPVKHSPKTENFNAFLAWIRNPKAPMPAYPSQVLSDQQADHMYQYITHVVNRL
jgi:uncharacterized membrane protein